MECWKQLWLLKSPLEYGIYGDLDVKMAENYVAAETQEGKDAALRVWTETNEVAVRKTKWWSKEQKRGAMLDSCKWAKTILRSAHKPNQTIFDNFRVSNDEALQALITVRIMTLELMEKHKDSYW